MKPKYTQPKPQTAEQINAQVGSVKVEAPPMRPGIAASVPAPFLATDEEVSMAAAVGCSIRDARAMRCPLVLDQLADAAKVLKGIRDSRSYLIDGSGAHSFREWCMNKFGEGFGRIIDDNL